jgi:hypothetical protein
MFTHFFKKCYNVFEKLADNYSETILERGNTMSSDTEDKKAPDTPTGDGGATTQVLDAPQSPPKKKELSGKQVTLILGSVAIVAAAVVAIVLLTRPDEPVSAVRVIDQANVTEIQEDIQSKVDQSMFETYMTTSWNFPDGQSPSSDAVMGNSVNNNYPFWFELTLADTGEVLFESGLLPVGTTIESVTLSKDLPAGSYPASVTIHLVDENNNPFDSNAAFNVTLNIAS